MSLAKTYCKEIIKELDKIPVFLPGTPVNVGDIITFGKSIFEPKPIGSFRPVSTLSSFNIPYKTKKDHNPDPYRYASKGAVGVTFTADANVTSAGNGKLDITFNQEEATYFAALSCSVTSIVDTSKFVQQLLPFKESIDWGNCFIVTSVTIAERALIMQSNSQSANLVIQGDVKGLEIDSNLNIDAEISVRVNSYKDSAFIKDWSKNVTVFFTLTRFRKKFLSDWEIENVIDDNNPSNYELVDVSTDDLLIDDNE